MTLALTWKQRNRLVPPPTDCLFHDSRAGRALAAPSGRRITINSHYHHSIVNCLSIKGDESGGRRACLACVISSGLSAPSGRLALAGHLGRRRRCWPLAALEPAGRSALGALIKGTRAAIKRPLARFAYCWPSQVELASLGVCLEANWIRRRADQDCATRRQLVAIGGRLIALHLHTCGGAAAAAAHCVRGGAETKRRAGRPSERATCCRLGRQNWSRH